MARKQSQFVLVLSGNICVSVLVLCIGAFGIVQQVGAYDRLLADHAELKQEQQKIEEDLGHRQQREDELKVLESKLASLDENLVDYKFIPSFLQQIQTTTLKTGNVLQNLQPREIRPLDLASSALLKQMNPGKAEAKPPEDANANPDNANPDDAAAKKPKVKAKSPYQVQSLSLDIAGTYPSVMQYLDALHEFRKMIYVRIVNLNPRQQNKQGLSLSAHIEADLIIIPDQFRPENEVAKGLERGQP